MKEAPRSITQRVAAWVVCIGFALLSLAYLNGAFFSAWVASGPPNDNPLGWERRALGQLGFCLACMLLSVGSFGLVSKLPRWPTWAVVVIAVGLFTGVSPYVGRFLLQDACLDRGGSWSHDQLVCVTATK